MAYFSQVLSPVSAELPCGIEIDGNPEMQSFVAVVEGELPLSYRDFDRKNFDDKGIIARIGGFLEQSHDLRLLVLAGKTFALSENYAGFFEVLGAIAGLLETHWEAVPPRVQDGDFGLRSAYLQSLEDMPTVLLPLQVTPLIKDKRLGSVAYRALLLARKAAVPRGEEPVLDEREIADAFRLYEPLSDLVELKSSFETALNNLERIRTAFITKAGHGTAPDFDKLQELLRGILKFLGETMAERLAEVSTGEALAPPADGDGAGGNATAQLVGVSSVATSGDASQALQAAARYYQVFEPSSPALLLVRQAEQLIGKSFVEAMQVLAPALADTIRIEIGSSAGFVMNFEHLQKLVQSGAEEASASNGEAGYQAASRAAASELMAAVERFYKQVEPSSPIPLLLERARRFASRDFAALLKEMSPPPAN